MVQNDIHIILDIQDFSMPQAGNGKLMCAFIRARFCMEELATLNRCHMHCWVIFMSDICMGMGEQVNSQWLQGKVSDTYVQYAWPWTSTLMAGEWSIWHRAIHVALNLDSYLQLPRKLGEWQLTMDTQNCWYMMVDDQRLWYHSNSGWHIHTKIPHCLQTVQFHMQYQMSAGGPDLVQCQCITMVVCYQHILVQLGGPMVQSRPVLESLSCWHKFQNSKFSRAWKLEMEVTGKV